jgi:hypothetical protein
VDGGLVDLFQDFFQPRSLADYHEAFRSWTFLEESFVSQDWQEDREFGRQRLNGLNPLAIRKCHLADLGRAPDQPITNDLVQKFLDEGQTLESALQNNRLYVLDYQILANILTPELADQIDRYAQESLCFLYVNHERELVPIAIQLHLTADAPVPVWKTWTPDAADWLTAKTAIASADMTHQGVVTHLLYTHLMVEPFAVATYRQLSPTHLIYQLLQPHFFNTFAINTMARSLFLGHGKLFDLTSAVGYTGSNDLLQRSYTGRGRGNYEGQPWEFFQRALPFDLEQRQVRDIPNYHYRDDALMLWQAIEEYVTEIVRLRYPTQQDLIDDPEIQAWKNELVSPTGGQIRGLLPPDRQEQLTGFLTSAADLIAILTNLVFTATAQHSAVNFGQYDYASWIPNMPFAMYASWQNPQTGLVDRLPNYLKSIMQIILVKTLSIAPPVSSQSLTTMANPFQEAAARQIFQEFQTGRLAAIEQTIIERNLSLEKPYVYLMPSRVAQSIAI